MTQFLGTDLTNTGGTSAFAGGGGGGGATYAVAEVDFGATGVDTADLTVTNAAITTGSVIQAFLSGGDTTANNDALAHRLAALVFKMSCIPASGSFTLHVDLLMFKVRGLFKIRYAYV